MVFMEPDKAQRTVTETITGWTAGLRTETGVRRGKMTAGGPWSKPGRGARRFQALARDGDGAAP